MRGKLQAAKQPQNKSGVVQNWYQKIIALGRKGYIKVKAVAWVGGVSFVFLVIPVAFGYFQDGQHELSKLNQFNAIAADRQ